MCSHLGTRIYLLSEYNPNRRSCKKLNLNWSRLSMILIISSLLLLNHATAVVEGQSYTEFPSGLHVSYLIRSESLVPSEDPIVITTTFEFISVGWNQFVWFNKSWYGTWTYTGRPLYGININRDFPGNPLVFADTSAWTINDVVDVSKDYTIEDMTIQEWNGLPYECFQLENEHTGMLGFYKTTVFYHAEIGLLLGLYSTTERLNDSVVIDEFEISITDSNFDEFQSPLTSSTSTTTKSTTGYTTVQPIMDSLLSAGIFIELAIIIILMRWFSVRAKDVEIP